MSLDSEQDPVQIQNLLRSTGLNVSFMECEAKQYVTQSKMEWIDEIDLAKSLI